jgi:hypothetical protein
MKQAEESIDFWKRQAWRLRDERRLLAEQLETYKSAVRAAANCLENISNGYPEEFHRVADALKDLLKRRWPEGTA